MHLLGFAMAALVGLSLGVMGGGGSILTVPILVYLLGYSAKQAVPMSLVVVGTTSLAGVASHWRAGNVQLRTALAFGGVAMVGAFTGARIGVGLPGAVQLVLLAVIMVAAAIAMYRRKPRGTDQGQEAPPRLSALLLGVGLAVGVLTGIIGIGGGFLIVPALVLLGRVSMRAAIGTSLLVIAMNCASGVFGYLGHVDLPWGFIGVFTGIAVLGVIAGSRLARHLSTRGLQKGFAFFLVLVGLFILWQNRGSF